MNKTYLVTGAAGFIGGAVAKKLIKEGNEVITIDNLSTGYEDAIPKGVVFYKGDCQDYEVIKQLESYKFEAIYHIAGQSSGEISFDDPVYDLQTNAQSTLLLLKLSLKTECKKFIYASTMSVYGPGDGNIISESYRPVPKSFYGVGKLASEHYLRIYEEYGITSTALRLFNIYGPGQNLNNLRQGMVSIFVAHAIYNKHIHVKGSGDRFRDFVYIDDVVDAFLLSEARKTNDYIELNISTEKKTTVDTLVNAIQKSMPFNTTKEFSGSTSGDIFGISGNSKKALEKIGWAPKTGINEGLKLMTDWAITLINK